MCHSLVLVMCLGKGLCFTDLGGGFCRMRFILMGVEWRGVSPSISGFIFHDDEWMSGCAAERIESL